MQTRVLVSRCFFLAMSLVLDTLNGYVMHRIIHRYFKDPFEMSSNAIDSSRYCPRPRRVFSQRPRRAVKTQLDLEKVGPPFVALKLSVPVERYYNVIYLWRCWVRAFPLFFFFISRRRSEETCR